MSERCTLCGKPRYEDAATDCLDPGWHRPEAIGFTTRKRTQHIHRPGLGVVIPPWAFERPVPRLFNPVPVFRASMEPALRDMLSEANAEIAKLKRSRRYWVASLIGIILVIISL